jgi:hypothetical protein
VIPLGLVLYWYVLLRKNVRAVVWMLEIGLCEVFYLNAFIIIDSLLFLHRMFYLCKCYENFTAAYWGHFWATVIFVGFIEHFLCRFIITPYYLNKLRNVLNKFIWWWTLCLLGFFWYVRWVSKVSFVQLYVCNIS